MIFRDLVGGGGKAKAFFCPCTTEDRRRSLTTSLAGIGGDVGEVGWYEEAVDFEDTLEFLTAGGGSSKFIGREEKCESSLL